MTDEIFGIMNDADELMENVDYDPFGMNVVMEETAAVTIGGGPKVNLNSLTPQDLQDPEKLDAITRKINTIDTADKAAAILVKVNKVMTVGSAAVAGIGVAAGGPAGTNVAATGIVGTIRNAILGVIARKVKKAIANKKFNELDKVDTLLNTAIADMKKQLSKASEKDKQKLQVSISKAEAVKTYIATKKVDNTKANTTQSPSTLSTPTSGGDGNAK